MNVGNYKKMKAYYMGFGGQHSRLRTEIAYSMPSLRLKVPMVACWAEGGPLRHTAAGAHKLAYIVDENEIYILYAVMPSNPAIYVGLFGLILAHTDPT